MNSIAELEKALEHVLVSLYYMCYNKNELNARKAVVELIIKQMESFGRGISLDERVKLAEHINSNLEILYQNWRDANE